MERKPQTYANHAKFDPIFHFILAPVTISNLIIAIVRLARNPGLDTAWILVLSLALLLVLFRLRTYPLRVQDRLIRLEERMRLNEILPENFRARIGELTEAQLVALRFVCDAEIPAMVQQALANTLSNKQIKQSIKSWRPDYFRV